MRRLRVLAAAALSCAVLVIGAPSTGASVRSQVTSLGEPGGVFHRVSTPAILKSTGAIVGTNWSGYVAATDVNAPAKDSVSAVTGTWVVPTVRANTTDSYSSDWVGIDGWTSPSVEQIGTEQDWVGGTTSYLAWWEMYPDYPVYITSMTVSPGDTMTGDVSWITADTFQLSLTDVTTGVSFSTAQTLGQTADRLSAEWVHEAPSSNIGPLPLAQTAPVPFTGCQATINGITGAIDDAHWQSSSMIMVDAADPDDSAVLAEPSSFNHTSMVVAKPKPWVSTLSIGASASTVRRPGHFTLYGSLWPGDKDPSDLIVVQVQNPGSGRWSYSSTRQVYTQDAAGSGLWMYRYTPTLRGTYKFKASFAGEEGQTAAASRVLSAAVR